MKTWLTALALPALLAAAPVPIVAGAVRDQLGRPIGGALVRAGEQHVLTAADGTFVLETPARSVTITCTYCERATIAVNDDGTVAAIVQRYAALARDVPSPEDISASPLSRAPELFSLVPFAVLNDFRAALPGPNVALYGSRSGGLLVDNGVASYDSAAGVSPYRTIPGFDTAVMDVRDVSEAPRYADLAGGGTFVIDSISPVDETEVLGGSERAARTSFISQTAAASAVVDGDPFEVARRVDAGVRAAGSQYTVEANAYGASDTLRGDKNDTLSSSTTAVNVVVQGPGSSHPYAQVSADRAGYTALPLPSTAVWSDVAVQGGVRGDGDVTLFADIATRFSTALYSYGVSGVAREAGTTQLTRIDAGASGQSGALRWQAMAAGIDADTTTYGYGVDAAQHATAVTPSLDVDVKAAPQWDVQATLAETVDVPTLIERYYYGVPSGNAINRISILRTQLQYSDLHRLKIGVAATREGYSFAAPQIGLGVFASWQVSPQISLRTWTFRYGDVLHGYTPASAWLAFRSRGGVTADLIWQRDMLDYRPDPHVSASLALPVWENTALFGATETRSGRRFTTLGLRFSR